VSIQGYSSFVIVIYLVRQCWASPVLVSSVDELKTVSSRRQKSSLNLFVEMAGTPGECNELVDFTDVHNVKWCKAQILHRLL
jgi:hypothetical protein